MFEFLIGFACCYLLAAALEWRLAAIFAREEGVSPARAALMALAWPAVHFIMGCEE